MTRLPDPFLPIRLELPFPPSIWDMYQGWGENRRLSPEYAKWRRDAGWMIRGRNKPLDVPFVADIAFRRPNKRMDLDNRIKPTLDLLEHFGVIANDKLCERLSARWDAGLPCECVVLIQPVEEALAA